MHQAQANRPPRHERFSFYFTLYAVPFVLPGLIWDLFLLYLAFWFSVGLPAFFVGFNRRSSRATRMSSLGLGAALTLATLVSIARSLIA